MWVWVIIDSCLVSWCCPDAQWVRIEPLMPSSQGRRGRLFRDRRQVVEGII